MAPCRTDRTGRSVPRHRRWRRDRAVSNCGPAPAQRRGRRFRWPCGRVWRAIDPGWVACRPCRLRFVLWSMTYCIVAESGMVLVCCQVFCGRRMFPLLPAGRSAERMRGDEGRRSLCLWFPLIRRFAPLSPAGEKRERAAIHMRIPRFSTPPFISESLKMFISIWWE